MRSSGGPIRVRYGLFRALLLAALIALPAILDPISRQAAAGAAITNRTTGRVCLPALGFPRVPLGSAGAVWICVIDPAGSVTRTDYDAASRVIRTVVDPALDPDGNAEPGASHFDLTTDYAYDANGNRTRVTVDPGTGSHKNLVTAYTYDAMNRVATATVDPNPTGGSGHLARTTSYAYDELGRLATETAADGGVTTLTYDELGRLTKQIVDPNPTGQTGHLALTTQHGYDAAGRKTSDTDPRGYVTQYAYDDANRPWKITDAKSGTLQFGLNAAGEQTRVTNPLGVATAQTFDGLGNLLTQTVDPNPTGQTNHLNRTTTLTYDLAGRLATRTDARGVTATTTYDTAGREWTVAFPAVGSDAAGTIVYGYDGAGRRSAMSDPTGSTSWTYDAGGRLASVVSPQGTTGYTYDGANRRATMTLPGSRVVTYEDDAASAPAGITDWQSRTTSFTSTARGAVDTITRPNGVTTDYDYDLAGRLTNVEHADGSGTLAEFHYTLDADGNRTGVAVTGAAVTNTTEAYIYDELDRLIGASYGSGSAVTWTYDANGNRKTQTSGSQVTSYDYDAADELTGVSGAFSSTYTYDAAGNRLSAGSDTFPYDRRGALRGATVGGTSVSYQVDGEGERTGRAQGSTSTAYLWDRASGLPALLDDGTSVHLAFGGGEAATLDDSTSADAYPLNDALGSERVTTDGSGSVAATADYDAWGNVRASSGTQGTLGWAGEPADPTTGLVYLQARNEEPGTGRFAERDAALPNAGGTDGWNAYWYGNDSPVTLTDPNGRSVGSGASSIVDVAVDIFASIRQVFAVLEKVWESINTLPPIARPFVRALMLFAMVAVSILIFVAFQTIISAVLGGLADLPELGALFILRFLAWSARLMSAVLARCVLSAAACEDITESFPTRETNYEELEQEIQGALNQAVEQTPRLAGESATAWGTRVHHAAELIIEGWNRDNVFTEVSYLDGEVAVGNPAGSIRLDVVIGANRLAPEPVFDFKTGAAGLSQGRIDQIRGVVQALQPVVDGGWEVIIREVRPS